MPTPIVRETVYNFAVDLAIAARIFTLPQLAKHPALSGLSQPVKRASECLRPYAGDFIKTEGAYGEPYRFRLSPAARKRLGVTTKAVSGRSIHSEHWLALGDLYAALRFRGGVRAWEAEPKHSGGFDVFFAYAGLPVVAEVQRTPLTRRAWARKWEPRLRFLASREELARASWQPPGRVYRPLPLLVDLAGQGREVIGLPEGWLYARTPEEVPIILQRYRMKNAAQ
jgi:hypothetical protein